MASNGNDGKLRKPVECVIQVDGREIAELYKYLKEVRVEMSRKAAAVCTLTFDSVRDASGHWSVQDSGRLRPWMPIRIDAAFGISREEVMRGYVRDVKVDYPQDMSAATVTVTGQDESLLLDREHVKLNWSNEARPMSDGDIVRQIAADHGLDVQASSGLSNMNLNHDGTYIRFLMDRAEANGYELLLRAGMLYFRPPDLAGRPQPVILVYAGRATNCLKFSAQFDGHKPDEVRITRAPESGSSSDGQRLLPDLPGLGQSSATSDEMGLRPFAWSIQQPSGATAAEATARAQAKVNENAWKVVGEGELDGALYGHVLLTHQTVEVDGVGGTYDGLYYVDEVKHAFSADGYRQNFRLIRNAVGQETSSRLRDPLAAVR